MANLNRREFIRASVAGTAALSALSSSCKSPSGPERSNVGDGPSPDFSSNFAGADWPDSGKWVVSPGGGSNHDAYLQVYSGDAEAPSGRCLRTIGVNGDSFWNVITPASPPPTPQVGETITWRWYYMLVSGDGDGDYHPIDWGTQLLNSSPDFAVLKFVRFGGAWQPQIDIAGAPGQWYSTEQSILQSNEWYRFEIAWHRTGASSWTCDYRIYDAAGTLIVDTADMINNFGSDPNNTLDGVVFNNGNAAWSARLEIGSPGVGGLVGSPHEAERYAAVIAVVGDPVIDIPYPINGEG